MYFLGYDIGSSSIKASLVDAGTLKPIKVVSYPKKEMKMISHHPGWAEQHPEDWWKCIKAATKELWATTKADGKQVKSIGISYQMHGLVAVDKNQKVVRPSIIWCDSRAVEIGNRALKKLGKAYCYNNYLNAPGNFTASKLKWVKDNEPKLYKTIDKIMLPGDYVAMRMSGEINSTIGNLSEGVFWDFKKNKPAQKLLKEYGISEALLPEVKPSFSVQATLSPSAAKSLNLASGTPISYRAGDQPNNALSLGVVEPGDVAGTGGTSGVIYAVTDKLIADKENRVNSFAHVNYAKHDPRVGILLCINGAGSMYAWLRNNIAPDNTAYETLEKQASKIAIGSNGLSVLPFGNGAERMFNNKNVGAHFKGVQLNAHGKAHMYRATLEGIAFAFVYGMKAMNKMGIDTSNLKVGNDNLFRSKIFSQTISNLTGAPIKIIETTGATGAALGSAYGIKHFSKLKDAFKNLKVEKVIKPAKKNEEELVAYEHWEKELKQHL